MMYILLKFDLEKAGGTQTKFYKIYCLAAWVTLPKIMLREDRSTKLLCFIHNTPVVPNMC